MIINGLNFPSIGIIRAKPNRENDRYVLTIYPPEGGQLVGVEPATMVEIEVGKSEFERIGRVAPHLVARSWSLPTT